MSTDQEYRPMTVADLARYLQGAADEETRWRLIAEFLEEYRHEPTAERLMLLTQEPAGTGDQRWDVFLAALAEHMAAKDDHGAPPWAESRHLDRFWFPFNTRAAGVDAIVHAPAALRTHLKRTPVTFVEALTRYVATVGLSGLDPPGPPSDLRRSAWRKRRSQRELTAKRVV